MVLVAVWWMIAQERPTRSSSESPGGMFEKTLRCRQKGMIDVSAGHDKWRVVEDSEGVVLVAYDVYRGTIRALSPKRNTVQTEGVRGGMLCDEPGLGPCIPLNIRTEI